MQPVLTLLMLLCAARAFAAAPADDKNPNQPPTGILSVLLKGDTLEVYLNGAKVHSSKGNDLRTIPLTMQIGDCVVFRVSSPFKYRMIRFAFVDQQGAVKFAGTPATTVIRQLNDPNAPVPKRQFNSPAAKSGRADPKNTDWQDAKLPAAAKPIGLPEKRVTYEIAFTVPAVEGAHTEKTSTQPATTKEPPAIVLPPRRNAPPDDEKKVLAGAVKLPTEPAIARFKVDSIKQKPLLIRNLKFIIATCERMLSRLRGGEIDPKLLIPMKVPEDTRLPIVFQNKETKAERVAAMSEVLAACKKSLAEAENGKRLLVPFIRQPLVAGQVGRIENPRAKVFQVAGPHDVLVEISINDDSGSGETKLVWLTGALTSSIADDEWTDLGNFDDVFEVIGSKTYETALGPQRTVMQFRRLSAKQAEQVIAAANPAARDAEKK